MAAYCKTCGCDKAKHRREGFGRVCPLRVLNAEERAARELPPEPPEGESAIFVIDRSLLLKDAA